MARAHPRRRLLLRAPDGIAFRGVNRAGIADIRRAVRVPALLPCAADSATLPPMHTLGDMAAALTRAPVYLRGLQARFHLPPFEGARYSDAYLALLRVLVALRILGVSEDALRDLWEFEKKLLQLLHVDSTGSRTWFLDACGQTSHPERRLLLSNHDLGVVLPSGTLQLGLDFSCHWPELFAGQEMGEDALRVLRDCLNQRRRILDQVAAELPHVRAALHWAAPLAKTSPATKAASPPLRHAKDGSILPVDFFETATLHNAAPAAPPPARQNP